MKFSFKLDKIFILIILLILFGISLYTVYKEIKYFSKLELLTNPDDSENSNWNYDSSDYKEMLQESGQLKTINYAELDNDITKTIHNEIDDLMTSEYQIKDQLEKLHVNTQAQMTQNGIDIATQTFDVLPDNNAASKPVTDSLKKHFDSLGSDPPSHLVNHPKSSNYNPRYATPWWETKGNTPQFFKGNYIPIAATTCTQRQCLPDGFAQA